jgi:hypothetical protein
VTVITPGAGCSITSTATVSTAGAAGRFTFRAAFFTGAVLGLALATVRFVALALADLVALRALPRVAEFRFCTFDPFLRLAMIAPALVGARYKLPARHCWSKNKRPSLVNLSTVRALFTHTMFAKER